MESPVREQLEHLIPRGIAVGSGFVIDSYGATSSQTDLVLYERDICPVFSINDTLAQPTEGPPSALVQMAPGLVNQAPRETRREVHTRAPNHPECL